MAYSLKSAATITPELLDRLNDLASQQQISPLDVERLRFSAKRLERSRPEDYFMIEGLCASLLQDPAGVRENFQRAIEIEGWRSDVAFNYMIALKEAGDPQQGRDIARVAYSRFPDDTEFLRKLVGFFANGGDLGEAADVERAQVRLKAIAEDDAHLAKFVNNAEAAGASVKHMGALISNARDFLASQGYRRVLVVSSFDASSDGPEFMSFAFCVPGSAQEVRALEKAMLSRVVDQVDEMEAEGARVSVLDWLSLMLLVDNGNARLHAA